MREIALDAFKIFEKVHGEEQAKKIVTYFEDFTTEQVEKEFNSKMTSLATKGDVLLVKDDLKEIINDLKVLIEKNSKEQFKWMFVFFVPLYLTLLAFIVLYLSKLL